MYTRTVCAVTALLLLAAPALAGGIGVIDYNRVVSEYDLYKQYEQQLERYASELEAELTEFGSTALLTSEELSELNALKGKTGPTQEETARIDALKGLTKMRQDRERELEQKPSPTPEEQAEMRDLIKRMQDADQRFKDMNQQMMAKLGDRNKEYFAKVEANVRAMIETVAKEKGLDTVVNKDMRLSDRQMSMTIPVVLFGGIDISEDVLSRLNKKTPGG
jgi:Skp family chaperone for outer membrane proteins